MSTEPKDPPASSPSESTSATATLEKHNSTPAPSTNSEAPETPQQDVTNNAADGDYGSFPPGTIVLAKLKSFPPWPAIVIPYELVPEGVQKSKPKHPTQQRSTKKKSHHAQQPEKQDNRIWCVRFLRDDTYMWGGVNDISILTTQQIEKFLNDKKGKKLIKSAYEMALNPPDVEEFIIWGSNGKPIQIDNEADDADFEDEEAEEDGESLEDGDDDDDDDNDLDEDLEELKKANKKTPVKRGRPKSKKSSPAKRARTSVTPKKPKGKPGRKPGRKPGSAKKKAPSPEPEPETSSDEDWDIDDETEPPVAIDIPHSKTLTDELKRKTPLIKKARISLQDFFLESKELDTDSKTIKHINSTLDSLEKITEIQISLIKHFNLHKVLFDILKRPDLIDSTKDVKTLRGRIERLVEIWFNVKIEPLENWNFEEQVEQEQTNGDLEIKEENGKEESSDAVIEETNGIKEETKAEA